MIITYNKSVIGYSHIKDKKPCQDNSISYRDNEHIIITCCDGHGGKTYVRSKEGSKYASQAILSVLSSIEPSFFKKYSDKALEDIIKLGILCEWNQKVDNDYKSKPFHKKELNELNESERKKLKSYPVKAYGTTLSGAMLIGNKLVIVAIGDCETILVSKGNIERVFEEDDEPVANITYSMCQDDAYNYIKVRVVDFRKYNGIFLCSDGLSGPYQNYNDFNKYLIKPIMYRVLNNTSLGFVDQIVDELANKKGSGDDVTLSFIINDNSPIKYYNNKDNQ